MRKSLRTFAATLAAAGLITFGAVTTAQDDTAPEPPQPQSTADEIAESVGDPSSERNDIAEDSAEVAKSDTDSRLDTAGESTTNSEATEPTTDGSESTESARDRATNDAVSEQPTEDVAEHSDDEKQADNESDSDAAAEQQSEMTEDKAKRDDRQSLDTPPVPDQARDAAANSNAPRNADWRMIGYNNQWWYYSPQGQWMVRDGNQWRPYESTISRSVMNRSDSQRLANEQAPQPYSTAYRGTPNAQSMESQPSNESDSAGQLRYDRCGRPFICENGRRVYVQVSGESNTSHRESRMSATTNNAQPTLAVGRDGESRGNEMGDADDLGRPTPARDKLRSTPPAPPTAE